MCACPVFSGVQSCKSFRSSFWKRFSSILLRFSRIIAITNFERKKWNLKKSFLLEKLKKKSQTLRLAILFASNVRKRLKMFWFVNKWFYRRWAGSQRLRLCSAVGKTVVCILASRGCVGSLQQMRELSASTFFLSSLSWCTTFRRIFRCVLFFSLLRLDTCWQATALERFEILR